MQAEVNLDNVTKQGRAILREVIHEYFERDGIPKERMPADLVDRNIIPEGRKKDIPKNGGLAFQKEGGVTFQKEGGVIFQEEGRMTVQKEGWVTFYKESRISRGKKIKKAKKERDVFLNEFPEEVVDREPVRSRSRNINPKGRKKEVVDREPVLISAGRSGEGSEDVPRKSKSKSAPSRSYDEEHQKVEVVYTDEELAHMIALHLASIVEKISSDSVEGTPNPCPSLTSEDAIHQMFKQVFKDGVYSWEHVGLLFRCTAKACEKALDQTDEIIDKVMKLFRDTVAPWIVESGGWVSPPLDSVSTDGGERHSEVSGIPATEGQRPQTVVHGRAGTSPPYLGAGPETASEIQQSDLGLSHG